MLYLKEINDFIILNSKTIPLEQFVLIGSFIEEIIAPIPSPLVLTLSGSISKTQDHTFLFMGWLAVIGAIGKTSGAWLLYMTAVKTENILTGKFSKLLLLSPHETEYIGQKFQHGWKDYLWLFIARSTPVIPSAPLSVACGLIKLSIVTFLIATFAGSIIRNLLFLYFGYLGVSNFQRLLGGLNNAESIIQFGFFIAFIIIISWFYFKHTAFKRKTKKHK